MPKRDQRRTRQQAARREKVRKQKARARTPAGKRSKPPVEVTPHNLPEAMTAAVALHRDERLREAAAIYRRVLAIEPNHPDALSSLAMIEHQAARYPDAIEMLTRAIAIDGANPGYHMNLAAVQDAARNQREAEACYQRAIEIEPNYPDPYYNLGDLYLRQGKPDQAIDVFDACMAAIGREFHALAYKAHALDDAGRHEEARYLLNFDDYVKTYAFEPSDGFESIADFNAALAAHIKTHPTLQGNVMSTEHGEHTGELLREPVGPMGAMEIRIHEAVRWYIGQLPDDPQHPAVRWVPKAWKLTTWGVVMFDRGHERAHIHPNGWLSGVFYLELPDLIADPARKPEGWLEFGRPTTDLHVQSELTLRHYQPAYGQMFLFPSYFYHGTVPFRSDQERVCVAFDVEPLY